MNWCHRRLEGKKRLRDNYGMYGKLIKINCWSSGILAMLPIYVSISHNSNNPRSLVTESSQTTNSPNTYSPPRSTPRRVFIEDGFYLTKTASSAELPFDIDNSE